MLVSAKEFHMRLFTDDICKLFFVSNASSAVKGGKHEYDDISNPTDEELAAPALKLKLYDSEDFWNSFNFGYQNEELDEELVRAMKGESKSWKLIRCCTILTHESGRFGFFFVLVNPEAYKLWIANGKEVSHGHSLEQDKQMGIVWAHTGYGHHNFKITDYRYKKNGKLKKHVVYDLSTICQHLSVKTYCKNFVRIVIARYLPDYEDDNPNYEHFEVYEENRYS